MSLFIPLNHKRGGRFGCRVRVAGIEGRRWVVLDGKLDSLRHLNPGKFGNNAKCKIDPCRDTARREDMVVAHNASLFVTGANQGQ